MKGKFLILLAAFGALLSCNSENSSSDAVEDSVILEVTTFKLKSNENVISFNELDIDVESSFTSNQPGFLSRQSVMDEQGEYTVLVYWKDIESATASMEKFMTDQSVADYAGMINGGSMKMARYTVNEKLRADNSKFVEVMAFDTKEGTDGASFDATNKKVETSFTAKQKGFIQRVTGVDDKGRQVVAIYWDNKINSDAALQPFMDSDIAKEFMGLMNPETITMGRSQTLTSLEGKSIVLSNKDKVVALLNSFNSGDQTPISYINPEKYIQHNLGVGDGLEGFGAVMQHAPEGGFKANVIRAFQDGDYVFTHTEYDFFGSKVGFDVFRFEDGLIVEHWDNLLAVQKPNASGRTQLDGPTESTDLDKTEANKKLVSDLIQNCFINGQMDKMGSFFDGNNYIQHNPMVADGLSSLGIAMEEMAKNKMFMVYTKVHKVLGEGDFVLTISEGTFGGTPTSYYDLFRVENGVIAEHWDVIETIAPKSEWKNENGKF